MLRLVAYALTPILAIGLRKYEIPLTLILVGILVAVMYKRPEKEIAMATLLGITMSFIEYICIQFGMWRYFGVQHTIPTWLPVLWAIVVVFVVDVFAKYA